MKPKVFKCPKCKTFILTNFCYKCGQEVTTEACPSQDMSVFEEIFGKDFSK